MRKGYTLILSTVAASLLVTSAMALGPLVQNVPDVYITQNTTSAVEDVAPGANMFRYSSPFSLWDYVTTRSTAAATADKVFWTYAIKDANNATLQPTGTYLTPGTAAVHYAIGDGTVSACAPNSTEGSAAWAATINTAATQNLQDATGALHFRNIRLSPISSSPPYPAPGPPAGVTTLPAPVIDAQEASLFVTDKTTTPSKDTIMVVTWNTGVDHISAAGFTWTTERTYSDFTETAGTQPVWDPFEYDILYGGTDPGAVLTESKVAGRLTITSVVAQGSQYGPYAQIAPPQVNEFPVGSALQSKVLRGVFKAQSSTTSVASNPFLRYDLNGVTQGPGEGNVELSGTGTASGYGPTTTQKIIRPYLWVVGTGTIAPTFLLYDSYNDRGGSFYVDTNVVIESANKADILAQAGTVLYDRGTDGSQGAFVAGTTAGTWANAGSANFAGIRINDTTTYSNPTWSTYVNTNFTGTAMTIAAATSIPKGVGGLIKVGSPAGIYTVQANKLYLIKVRVAASSNTGNCPELRIITANGNFTAQFLLNRNIANGAPISTTPTDYYCVFESNAANAGNFDLGIEGFFMNPLNDTPVTFLNLTVSRVTITEYPLN
jgi:hypothetical protein